MDTLLSLQSILLYVSVLKHQYGNGIQAVSLHVLLLGELLQGGFSS